MGCWVEAVSVSSHVNTALPMPGYYRPMILKLYHLQESPRELVKIDFASSSPTLLDSGSIGLGWGP